MRYVIDASALLRLVDDEAGAERMEELLDRGRTGRLTVLMSAVNWGEVVYVAMRAHGIDAANRLAARLRCLPIQIASVDAGQAEAAALFKQRFKLPYADAFAGMLAQSEGATLITADYDFKAAAAAIKVEFLPVSAKRPPTS